MKVLEVIIDQLVAKCRQIPAIIQCSQVPVWKSKINYTIDIFTCDSSNLHIFLSGFL